MKTKLYRLPVVIHEPSSSTEDKYMMEVPLLPGCRAWGNSAADALANLQSVAEAFIESYHDLGDPLPPEVLALACDDVSLAEVIVVA